VLADVIRDYSISVLRSGETSPVTLEALFSPLEERARCDMAAEGVSGDALHLERSLDMRYRGQSFELTIPLHGNFRQAFHQRYQSLYGFCDEGHGLEIVTLRLRAVGRGPQPDLTNTGGGSGSAPCETTNHVVWKGVETSWPVYQRDALAVGSMVHGPALIVEDTATHLLAPDWRARVDSRCNLILERGQA